MSNKSAKRVTLLDIPDEIMRYISRFLMIEDFLHLSMTCKRLYHMLPRYIFEYKMIYSPESGPSIWTPDFGEIPHKGHGDPWPPSFYFDTPPFTSHLFMATISGRIWGRGYIDLQLIRPHQVCKEPIAIEKHYNILSSQPDVRNARPTPYSGDLVNFLTIEDPIIDMIQPGDYFRFIKIDGLGEHPLRVENFRVHTRGLRNKPTIVAQKRDSNALTQYSVTCSEKLHCKKDCFANIVKRFKKKDETEMKGYRLAYCPNVSSTVIIPDGPHAIPNTEPLPPFIPLSEWDHHHGIPPFNINDYI